MNPTIGISQGNHGSKVHFPPVRVAWITLSSCLAILFGLVIAEAIDGAPIRPIETPPPPVASAPQRELPSEWRWQPRTVKYEHMYGGQSMTPKNDWIRHGGASTYSGASR